VAVLRSFPFDRLRVSVWAVENNTGTPETGSILRPQGYVLAEVCGPDEIWRHSDLSQ
jgi:hypothetical protein